MSTPNDEDLHRQIAELREETRRLRRWVMFAASGVFLILLLPPGGLTVLFFWALEHTKSDGPLAPAVALVTLFLGAAFFVSRSSTAPADKS